MTAIVTLHKLKAERFDVNIERHPKIEGNNRVNFQMILLLIIDEGILWANEY